MYLCQDITESLATTHTIDLGKYIIHSRRDSREICRRNTMINAELSPATDSMEAFLVHRTDPSLHLKLPETSLNQTTPLTIGRQAGAHLLIDEPSVSRRHAVI